MKNIHKIGLTGFGLLLSLSANSAEYITGEVERIYPNEDGAIYFRIKGDTCNISPDYYYFNGTRAGAKNWYAILLLATSTGRRVTVSAYDCAAGNKSIRYVLIDAPS